MIAREVGRAGRLLALALLAAMVFPSLADAAGAVLRGRLVHALSGDPVAGAVVMLQETRQLATADPDGSFTFQALKPGRYHVVVISTGLSSRHMEVDVAEPETAWVFKVEPELHFAEVVSVSAEPRDQFRSYQPTSVLAGQDLTRELGTTLGATLLNQPGMALRSFGAAPARPVIRGLDGDRVQILEDGQRTGDLSSQSGDHGVTINPAASSKIEVVRGPATLMFGSNAIGGLVNVISNAVPNQAVRGTRGTATIDLGSNAGQATGGTDAWWGNGSWALHAGGGGGRASDYRTPEAAVDNTQSRSAFGSVGLSWTGAHGYLGGSYGYEDTRYGIPYVEEGLVELTPRRHLINVRGEAKNLGGFFSAVKGSLASRRYRHEEVVAGDVGTRFRNDTTEVEVSASHRAVGAFSGTLGAWVLDRGFSATGDEALSPPIDQRGFAAFLYEEVAWHHVTLQFGGRVDHAGFEPRGGSLPARDFTEGSASIGVLVSPAFADHRSTFALSLARTARHPALEELYFNGPHPGNFAYEIGNPDLQPERALGVDASWRWRSPRFSTELTYFRNDIDGYIYRNPVDGLPDVEAEAHDGHHHDAFPVVRYVGRDSVLQGVEIHGDVQLGGRVFADFGADYVRGELKDTGEPLPRMPPLRGRVGLQYRSGAFNAGSEVTAVSDQKRVSGAETATAGYALLKLHASYSFVSGRTTSTVTARADNVTDRLYRSHLSYVKDFVPEMGRTFKLVYRLSF